jgi:hypothetical protein
MATEVISEIARIQGVPEWWVEAIAVEYTDCRRLAAGNAIWEFDFQKVGPRALEEALRSHRVVVFGRLIHNVRREVWAARAVLRSISDVPATLVEEIDDMFAEGRVADYSFPWIGNPIEVWIQNLTSPRTFRFWTMWGYGRGESLTSSPLRAGVTGSGCLRT